MHCRPSGLAPPTTAGSYTPHTVLQRSSTILKAETVRSACGVKAPFDQIKVGHPLYSAQDIAKSAIIEPWLRTQTWRSRCDAASSLGWLLKPVYTSAITCICEEFG